MLQDVAKNLTYCEYKEGEFIIRKEEAADFLYLIYEGEVEILNQRDKMVGTAGPMMLLGEASAQDPEP
jgi:CRP-like cAMP-binding protein